MSGTSTRDDWTTDPDHSGNGIEFAEYNEDGVLEPIDDRRTMLEGSMLFLLRKLLGNRAESQGHLYFPGSVAERLWLRTQRGNRSSYVKPDLMVFPPAYVLPADAHRDRSDCALRVHEGAPPAGAGGRNPVGLFRGAGLRSQAAVCMQPSACASTGYVTWAASAIRTHPWNLQVYRLTDDQTYVEVPPTWTGRGPGRHADVLE